MEAHTTLYTLLESIKDAGKITDGEYLTAMNALQQTYDAIPRPAAAVTGGGFVLVPAGGAGSTEPAPLQWRAAWDRLFELPPEHSCLRDFVIGVPVTDQHRRVIIALDTWQSIILSGGAPMTITHLLETNDLSHFIVSRWYLWALVGHRFRRPQIEDYFRRDKLIRDYSIGNHIDGRIGFMKRLQQYEEAPAEDRMSIFLGDRAEPPVIIRHIRGARGKLVTTSPPSTYHRISVELDGMEPFIAYTPLIQLARSNRVPDELRALRFIHLTSQFGIRESNPAAWATVWIKHFLLQRERSYLSRNHIARPPTLQLAVSGITGRTKNKQRTYTCITSTLETPLMRITYIDALNTPAATTTEE